MEAPHALVDFAAGPQGHAPLQLAFGAPVRELIARSVSEVRTVLEEVDALARSGLWCVGYLRYEAATAFDAAAVVHEADGPLAYFSIHERTIDLPDFAREPSVALDWSRAMPRARFDEDIARIRTAIADGEVYQVNYTAALQGRFDGEPFNLFCALRRAQPHGQCLYVANNLEAVLSVSPELFFDWQGDALNCRPMKGTAARGLTPEGDLRHRDQLARSEKERAENVMIVDLLRNDMSRIAMPGSVQVPRLFDCEAWPTVWQMTSSIAARTRPGTRLVNVFEALFPCGSVTGAPKLRAMHWIRELEPQPRGVYCGAAGVVLPGGAARFNVPIRTVTLRQGEATCGIGSGITAGATAEGEWAEWARKAHFLEQASRPFQLLQTMRVQDGKACALELHLDRLAAAAAHFGFAFDRGQARRQVDAGVAVRSGVARARITVDLRGSIDVEMTDIPHTPAEFLNVTLAGHPMSAAPAFLRHKTTRREHYERFAPVAPGVFDTLLWNERGEVTEFTRGNVIMEMSDGSRVTPPLDSGLLDGVGRACELGAGRVHERVVRVGELPQVRRLWFVNALRGLREVKLTP